MNEARGISESLKGNVVMTVIEVSGLVIVVDATGVPHSGEHRGPEGLRRADYRRPDYRRAVLV